jgi:hypothetical protein
VTIAAALAACKTTRCDIVIVGDSVTEGEGATAMANRWANVATAQLRAAYGVTGGLGFISLISTGENTYTWPIVLASGTEYSDFDPADLGPVRNDAAATGTCSWTFTAPAGTTSVRVMYFDVPLSGSFTYQVNSGSVTTVSNTSTEKELVTASIPMGSGDVLTIAYDSGSVWIDGIIHYAGDETAGLTVHACGHVGWCAGTEGNGWDQPETYSLNWAQGFSNGFPNTQGLGIFLGINDASTANGDRTGPQFQSDLEGLISTIRGSATPLASLQLVLIVAYEANETFADSGGWPAYITAIENAAAADGNALVMNLVAAGMPAVSGAPAGWYYDAIHPADMGHAFIGDTFASMFPAPAVATVPASGEYDRGGLLRKPFLW